MATTQVVNLSHLAGAKRIDPEFYQPDYLLARDKVLLLPTKTIAQISSRVVSFGAYSLCNYIVWRESGIPYLKAENILDGYIDYSEAMFIDEDVHRILAKSEVHEGQVLFSMSGTTGNAAVAYKIPTKLNASQDVAKITIGQGYSPFYVAAFLNSKYGRLQTQREIVGSVQQHVFLWQIKNFLVPIVPKDIVSGIEELQKEGLNQLSASYTLYSQAESLLLEELGLKDFKMKYELSYTTSLSKAFGAHRVDAEYFQPSYEKLVGKLTEATEVRPLKYFILDIKRGIEVGGEQYQEEGKPFIRVSNLSIHGLIERDQKYVDETLYTKLAGQYQPKVGELLLTKDATPGIAHVIKEPIEGIIAGGILRLSVNETRTNKEYLALCINSLIGKLQIERDGGGSVIRHWRPEQIKKLVIPLLSGDIQKKIESFVRQSHDARGKAKQLLEEAKSKVEDAIDAAADA
jgi:type I restriction enzyme S subunit